MKASERSRIKPERVKVGNVTVTVYDRRKPNTATGKKYEIWEVSDYTSGTRRPRADQVTRRRVSEVVEELIQAKTTRGLPPN